MLLAFDLDPSRPRAAQVVARLEALIRACHLAPGTRLPSTRMLAERLGLHRDTIARAYQTLWALGWLELRPGAAPRVRGRLAGAEPPSAPVGGGFDWAARLGVVPGESPRRAARWSFADLGMDPRLMPVAPFARSVQAVLRRRGTELLGYGDPQGLWGLREALCHRAGRHGMAFRPEQVLVTHGAQQALDLVLRALVHPGQAVVVESPTYDLWLRLLERHGARVLPMPERDGAPDLDALEALVRRERPVLLYAMPSFQNPSGRSLEPALREGLLALCVRHALPILEDGFEEEMKYFGRPIPPLAARDSQGLVLYAGTCSKILFPGLRLGWLMGDARAIHALAELRRPTDLGPSPLLQAALEDFLRKGHFDAHLARLHRAFRRRMEAAVAALRRELDPGRITWQAPDGGYLLWLEVKEPPPRADLEAALARAGVAVRFGEAFFVNPEPSRCCLRLSISQLEPDEITEGLRRLGRALREA